MNYHPIDETQNDKGRVQVLATYGIRPRKAEDVPVLDLNGVFNLNEGAAHLRNTAAVIRSTAIKEGKKPQLIVNLSRAIGDSSFLGELAGMQRAYENPTGNEPKGSVAFIGVEENGKLAGMLNTMKMYLVLNIYPDEETAVKFPEIKDRHPIAYRPADKKKLPDTTVKAVA